MFFYIFFTKYLDTNISSLNFLFSGQFMFPDELNFCLLEWHAHLFSVKLSIMSNLFQKIDYYYNGHWQKVDNLKKKQQQKIFRIKYKCTKTSINIKDCPTLIISWMLPKLSERYF
jgi:hypothetical protein